jgi:GTPase SAR1 family protein
MCSNPFGIVDSQLLFQCSKVKCGEQYCNKCVQANQGSFSEHPFVCISCKKNVTPKRNMLIEKHIIWKNMCKLYGIQSLLDLKNDSNKMFFDPILKDIEFRLIHLQCRRNNFQKRLENEKPSDLFDEQLINNVNDLCIKLKNLIERIKQSDQEMQDRGIVVSNCLKKYKKNMKNFDRLCDTLIKIIENLEMNNKNVTTDAFDDHKEHIKQLYRMNDLDKLSSEQNIEAIDEILEDAIFRRKCLLSRLEAVTSLLKGKPDKSKLLQDDLEHVKEKLEIISIVINELNYVRESLQAIERYTHEYDKLLRDDKFQHTPCSKFILLLEMMRVRTEELAISNHFPQTVRLMGKWQNDHGKDDEFKPKVLDLFEAIEMDVKHLLSDENCIYSLSYRIGVIGDGSVGKSALVMNLADVKEFSSMISVERSTFGYLEFDTLIYKDLRNGKIIPITFVDIEGATDADKCQSTGNYIELIEKADCDMYIIVFDRPFNDHNRTCQEYIENILQRKCLLVWSKADLLFNQFFRQAATGKKYEKKTIIGFHEQSALKKIEQNSLVTFDDKRLSKKVYLTAAACDDDDLKDAPFATFDLNKLKKKFVQLAMTDFRGERICKLAIRASITVINTCFRRGYTVSQTKYRWLAAGASVVPFLDQLPAFFGREKIRQAFGIHDSFAVTNAVHRTKDSFEEYLIEKTFTVPEEYLKSGYFKYLRPAKTKKAIIDLEAQTDTYFEEKSIYNVKNKRPISKNTSIIVGQAAQNIGRPTIVGKVADDAARFLVPTATGGLRAVSLACIVVGGVLTPVFAAWSFYSTGKRMDEHLHLLCDDLVVILQYFAVNLCNDCCRCIQLPRLPSSDKDSSSSDDD